MEHNDRQHPDWMREFDHTADVGIEVEASDLSELFERAAYAMFWLLSDVDAVEPDVTIPIRIDAGDFGELMVNWLSELNYRHQIDGLVFSSFEVRSISNESLSGAAAGEAIADDGPAVFGELKAVTYHELVVDCGEVGCRARIIFDI